MGRPSLLDIWFKFASVHINSSGIHVVLNLLLRDMKSSSHANSNSTLEITLNKRTKNEDAETLSNVFVNSFLLISIHLKSYEAFLR